MNKRQESATAGWQLADVYDTRGYWTVAVVPHGPRFATPHDAHQFVWDCAKRGDKECRDAMSAVVHTEMKNRPQK